LTTALKASAPLDASFFTLTNEQVFAISILDKVDSDSDDRAKSTRIGAADQKYGISNVFV
jgi:hypothetical protein